MSRLSFSLAVIFVLTFAGFSHAINVTLTARDTSDRLSRKPDINWGTGAPTANVTFKVDTLQTYQEIFGFGGAFTDSAGYVLSTLTPSLQQQVLDAYFGPNGQQYTVCRTHIASCDFSTDTYTYAPVWDDFDLVNFTIAPDRKHIIPFIKGAIRTAATRPGNPTLDLFGSPWSPPAWMKVIPTLNGSARPTGLLVNPAVHRSYANYISKYLHAYKAEGINFWGLTIQNEPEFAPPWPGCCYTPEDMRDHLRDYLHPVLSKEHPDLKIMIYDHNKDHIETWVKTIFDDPVVRNMAHGTAFHWYSGPQFENLEKAHEIAPDKFLLASEACNCPGVLVGDWKRGENYGVDIMGDLNNWAIGWVDWNMILDMTGGPNTVGGNCDAPIVGDHAKQLILFQPPFWYMGHFSRFLPRGYKRINLSMSVENSPLLATAFASPDLTKRVVIVMNPTDNHLSFALTFQSLWTHYNTPPHSILTLQF